MARTASLYNPRRSVREAKGRGWNPELPLAPHAEFVTAVKWLSQLSLHMETLRTIKTLAFSLPPNRALYIPSKRTSAKWWGDWISHFLVSHKQTVPVHSPWWKLGKGNAYHVQSLWPLCQLLDFPLTLLVGELQTQERFRGSAKHKASSLCPLYLLQIIDTVTSAEAEAQILRPADAKNLLIRKDLDVGKDWRQEEKGTTEDEMVGWHHWLDGFWASSGS